MQKEHIYYGIIGAGVLCVIVMACIYFWPERKLSPPPILEQRILGDEGDETQRQAAQDIARHGSTARLEVRRSLQQYQGGDTKVRISLIDATAKNRDWRSLPELFRAMESPYPVIRARAAVAAEKIMGVQFFYKATDPPEKRAEILAQMRDEYEAMKAIERFQKFYTDQTE